MSDPILIDADPEDANWISELQRSKGRIPPSGTIDVTDAVSAWAPTAGEMAYDPNQPRDNVGRFGHKGATLLGAPTYLHRFSPEAQAKFHARAAELGPDFPQSVEEMADITLSVFDRATPEQLAHGMKWYQDAHDTIVNVSVPPVTHDQAAAVLAVCSPRTKWEKNLVQANAILKVHSEDAPFEVSAETYKAMKDKTGMTGPGTYKPSQLSGSQLSFAHPELKAVRNLPFGDHADQAFRILRGEPVDSVVSGTKVRNFYNNIRNPDDPHSVTIDAWQVRAMVKPGGKLPVPRYVKGPDGKPTKEPFTTTEQADTQTYFGKPSGKRVGIEDGVGMYPYFGEAALIAAKKRGILPQQLQAVTWLVTQSEGKKKK